MIYRYKLTRHGFNSKVEIGDVITNGKGEKLVVIEIESLYEQIVGQQTSLWADVIVQKPNTPDVGYRYADNVKYTNRYRIDQKAVVRPVKVGQILTVCEANEEKGALVRVEEVVEYHHEFTDLIVTWVGSPVPEWDQRRIDECIRADRLASFSVIDGGQQLVEQR